MPGVSVRKRQSVWSARDGTTMQAAENGERVCSSDKRGTQTKSKGARRDICVSINKDLERFFVCRKQNTYVAGRRRSSSRRAVRRNLGRWQNGRICINARTRPRQNANRDAQECREVAKQTQIQCESMHAERTEHSAREMQ